MEKSQHLINTIGTLYESILDEARWTDALRSLSNFAGGRGTFYLRANPHTGTIRHSESVDVDPLVNERYLRYYATKEVRLLPSLAIPVGQLAVEDMLIDARVLQHSEIYADLLLPFDIPNILMLWVEKTPGLHSAVVIERSYSQGKFSSTELREFSALVPHLMRALKVDMYEGEVERPRDRRRREGQDVDLRAELLEPLLGGDAEALLLVDDEEAEVAEADVLREQAVGARRRGRRSPPRGPARVAACSLAGTARERSRTVTGNAA